MLFSKGGTDIECCPINTTLFATKVHETRIKILHLFSHILELKVGPWVTGKYRVSQKTRVIENLTYRLSGILKLCRE